MRKRCSNWRYDCCWFDNALCGLDYEQSLFFLWSVEQNARHANGHARDWWRETGRPRFARLAASPLLRVCIALTKSEEKERLLAVFMWFGSHFTVGVTRRLLLSSRVSSLVINLLIFELTVIKNDKGRNSIVALLQSMPPVDWTSLQTMPHGVTLNDDHSVKTKRTRQYPARIWMYMQSNLKQSQNQAEKLIRNFQTSNAKLTSGPVKWTHS